jgi:hypothetical protein
LHYKSISSLDAYALFNSIGRDITLYTHRAVDWTPSFQLSNLWVEPKWQTKKRREILGNLVGHGEKSC